MSMTSPKSRLILLTHPVACGALVLLIAGLLTARAALDRPEPMIEDIDTGALMTPTTAPAASIASVETETTAAQYYRRRGRRRTPPRYPDPNAPIDSSFIFARVEYTSVRYEDLGTGWTTDYPNGDRNFMRRFEEFTTSPISWDGGYPNHVVVTLYDEELFKYPFIFMSDVGTIGLDSFEVERLRDYLLRGGFLWVDDFWGWRAWDQWQSEIGRVLPPDQYPILDILVDHPLRQILYPVDEIPQIPSIQWYRQSGGYTTSERGRESATPHLRSISDENGRIMVLMSHNTDIADGWERENEDFDFFTRFSYPSYAVGINVILYARSH